MIDKVFNNSENEIKGFVCEYYKDISKYAKVSYIMDIPENLIPEIRKKEEAKCPKFTIYGKGSITQSVPHPELARKCREDLMNVINKYINLIKCE